MLSNTLKEELKNLPTILSIREVMGVFSFSRRTVIRLIRKGKLPAWKDSENIWCIARADLIEFISQHSNL